jgi:hypothetical protein
MTESYHPDFGDGPGHGEPGHECKVIDASHALGGIIITPSPDNPGALVVDAWAKALSKRDMAQYLRMVADSWEEDADLEDAQAQARERN